MATHLRLLVLYSLLTSACPVFARDANSPFGAWRGESRCLVRPSSCHDEDALYRISATDHANRVRVSGGKIVDGQEVVMGVSDCGYDSGAIDCPLQNGNALHLDVKGEVIVGTMKLRDGTLWRSIKLHRSEK